MIKRSSPDVRCSLRARAASCEIEMPPVSSMKSGMPSISSAALRMSS